MKRYEVLREELESGSASAFNVTDKERAIAAAAAETFEAREEEEEGQQTNGAPRGEGIQWLLPVFGGRKNQLPGGPESFARSARVLRDNPQKLRLLQVCMLLCTICCGTGCFPHEPHCDLALRTTLVLDF